MIIRAALLLGLLFNLLTLAMPASAQENRGANRPLRILHIMSFNSPYRWTDGQFDGFKAGLGTDVKADYQVFQLDTKRQSSKEEQERNARKARQLIADWKPDLVYTSDDDAISLVTKHYVNSPIPFVFSGVNRTAEELGIQGASNITGVLEREHILETIHLMQALKPGVKRIQVFSDNAAYWPQVIGRIRSIVRDRPDFELVGVDQPLAYADFQRLALENPNKADAYLILGNFNFKDAKGADVPYPQLQRWLTENSKVPDMSFWDDRMLHGTLTGVTVSAFEQGLGAGKLARAILVRHQKPATLPIVATTKGVPVINLERARLLGITPRSTQLLSAQIVTTYEWNK
ncbi:ABC transporter substrate binding protein [Uliginosibacterium sp. 31-16]|uniref:ABC transporter substrate-binding protein n=1 Tax=Uliginosibacterium sp. 31-16 TaxID=3068315 RepID=UPI00273F8016|nr:ABC transporter substrate binding protein [Uliginosibacterium sp. 31-16]MDP5240173.1 ABC transporter substrate binding protein [Uliginosibacterium sp. 31-16]